MLVVDDKSIKVKQEKHHVVILLAQLSNFHEDRGKLADHEPELASGYK